MERHHDMKSSYQGFRLSYHMHDIDEGDEPLCILDNYPTLNQSYEKYVTKHG